MKLMHSASCFGYWLNYWSIITIDNYWQLLNIKHSAVVHLILAYHPKSTCYFLLFFIFLRKWSMCCIWIWGDRGGGFRVRVVAWVRCEMPESARWNLMLSQPATTLGTTSRLPHGNGGLFMQFMYFFIFTTSLHIVYLGIWARYTYAKVQPTPLSMLLFRWKVSILKNSNITRVWVIFTILLFS